MHFCEVGVLTTEGGVKRWIASGNGGDDESEGHVAVKALEELRHVWPEIFKPVDP